MKQIAALILMLVLLPLNVFARECNIQDKWSKLCHVLEKRINQTCRKMKLEEAEAREIEEFTNKTNFNFEHLNILQEILPKTTVELLMSVKHRAVNLRSADLMAEYLNEIVQSCKFKNIEAFDNNTSHIIGRNFYEIDYSGEPLTQHRQKEKYSKYGITDFKSVGNLKKFFPVESKLPYFQKIYRPGKCEILK